MKVKMGEVLKLHNFSFTELSCFNTYSLHAISFSLMLFCLLKHYLDTDTALKVSQSVYCFTTSISHRVEKYFPILWGRGISDAILYVCYIFNKVTRFYVRFLRFNWF